jgi:DNA recombination protein RmuC
MSSYLIVAVVALGFLTSLYLIRLWITGSKVSDSAVSQWLKSVQLSLDSSTRMMADVQHQLGEMSEVGRGIRSLQEFLQSPKLRGGIGEQILGEMIGETFPKNAFHLQYSFRSGVKVDAVLKTDAGLLCIDSKFPISNFAGLIKNDPGSRQAFISDVKKHITDIAQKYILPDEGTMDFALMYIPSESVYYEVVNLPELTKIARDARVYPVSPNTLYAHLQVLLTSFQGKELEAKSREVFKILRGLQKDYDKMGEGLGTLNRHLTNAFNQMSQVSSRFTVFGQKLSRTNTLSLPEAEEKS